MPDSVSTALDRLSVNTIKMLAVDAVEQAKSGHPGMPMGAADYAYILWSRFLRHDPSDPAWPDRDRFVLSAGHGCMLLYALLHLSGYDLSLDDLKQFRQWGSKTPGHPEFGHTAGVETTTGPLGQGFGNGVGMAIAAKMLAARMNAKDFSPVTHRVFGIVSDGDLMEGVASEAASIAGHLALGNLIYIYDDNHISIEGDTRITFTEDVGKRFEAYGWHVEKIDGHDHVAIDDALRAALDETARPSIIVARTHIANGAPHKHDNAESHGSPLGADEVAATKQAIGWPESPKFHVPGEVRAGFAARAAELKRDHGSWTSGFSRWRAAHPDLAQLWDQHAGRVVPADLAQRLLDAAPKETGATRVHSGKVIQTLAPMLPFLIGGSADLGPSTSTTIKGSSAIGEGSGAAAFAGRNFHWGVREHGMVSVCNGIAAHGYFLPFGATFLQFADYMRPALRLAALARLPVISVFTHDSIFLGEDGPTHQPIEHLTALRSIPNLVTIRPFDGAETALAWAAAVSRRDGPTALVLSRQSIANVERDTPPSIEIVARGGYVLKEASGGAPALVLIATGSEVPLAVEARLLLEAGGTATRVVSMPSLDLFFEQGAAYRDSIVPDRGVALAAIEAASPDPWFRVVGKDGLIIGIRRFGASAPANILAEKFGFTGPQAAARISTWLKSRRG